MFVFSLREIRRPFFVTTSEMPALQMCCPLVFRAYDLQFNPYFLRLSSRVFRLMPSIAALLLIL
jgi:hypothetical protein